MSRKSAPIFLILTGLPACGKSTLAKKAAEYLKPGGSNVHVVEMSDLLKKIEEPVQAQTIKELMDAGEFAPCEVVNDLAEKTVQKIDPKYDLVFLVGFARTVVQAMHLTDTLRNLGINISYVKFEITKEDSKHRLKKGETENTRKARKDSAEIDKRLDLSAYHLNIVERFFMSEGHGRIAISRHMDEQQSVLHLLESIGYPVAVSA